MSERSARRDSTACYACSSRCARSRNRGTGECPSGWRRCRPACTGSQPADLGWIHRDSAAQRRAGKLGCGHPHAHAVHLHGIGEGALRNRHCSARRSQVCRVEARTKAGPPEAFAKAVDVRNPGIVDIYSIEVAESGVVPRKERLTPAQWAPADAASEAKAKTYAPTGSAIPGNQRGSIEWTTPIRSGCPSPIAAPINPTAIMKWGESPRFIINPGPSPGSNPSPATVVIGRPVGRYRRRSPNLSVVRRVVPSPILVQIL